MVEVEPELKCAFISKAREHLCSLEAEGKEANWKETYSRIMQLAKEELGESTQSHGCGMMLCSKRCLRKGGCSENDKYEGIKRSEEVQGGKQRMQKGCSDS